MNSKNETRGEDLFSGVSSELITATEAAALVGVSYQKFLSSYWSINFKYLYPGGPRIYTRAEVLAFLEGKKNKK